jgi:predicted ATPase
MISSIQIKGFRGVREGQVEKLSPISILVGPNNSGKSTCLEAIACVGFGSSAAGIADLLLRRGGPALNALRHVFADNAKQTEIAVHGQQNENEITWKTFLSFGGPRDVNRLEQARREGLKEPISKLAVNWQHPGGVGESQTHVDQNGKISTSFIGRGKKAEAYAMQLVDVNAVRGIGALENAYSELEKTGQLKRAIQALSSSMTGLTDLRILKADQTFVLHAVMQDPPPIPVFAAGDGFKRFLELAASMVSPEPGVVLLEEPESYQHPRYMRALATLMLLSARAGTQIILSTHNIELIDCLLSAPEAAGLAYPSVHRFRLAKGELSAVALDHQSALNARQDLLEDLRA